MAGDVKSGERIDASAFVQFHLKLVIDVVVVEEEWNIVIVNGGVVNRQTTI